MSKDFNSKTAEKALTLAIETCGPKRWARTLVIASIYYDFLTGKTLNPPQSRLEKLLNWLELKVTKDSE